MTRELKPCPFCGNHNPTIVMTTDESAVKCNKCSGHFKFFSEQRGSGAIKPKTRKELIRIWNLRSYL